VAAPLTKAESKYGNGAMVSQEFKPITSAENNPVNVHHIHDAKPTEMRSADPYV
jgi:hypothetical protein